MGKRKQKASVEIKQKTQIKIGPSDAPKVINEMLIDQLTAGVRTQTHIGSVTQDGKVNKSVST